MNHGGQEWSEWQIKQVESVTGVIAEVLASRPALADIFNYLAKHRIDGLKDQTRHVPSLTGAEILQALPHLVKPKRTPRQIRPSDPKSALRALKQRLKLRLESFALSNDGRRLPYRFDLSGEETIWDLQPKDQSPAMKRFWEPYFQDCSIIRIIYGENVFFRNRANDCRSFMRHMDVNNVDDDATIKNLFKLPSDSILQGGRQFVSAGDCAAVLELVRQFERNGLRTEVTKAHTLPNGWMPEKDEGLIVLGNGRVIPPLAELCRAERLPVRIEGKRIVDSASSDNPEDNFLVPLANGLVARTYSKHLACWITLFASNHGRFMEKYVKLTLSEEELPSLFEQNKWRSSKPVPKKFAFTAQADLTPFEEIKAKEYGTAWGR